MKTINVDGMITNNDDAEIYRDWIGMTVACPNDISDALPDDNADIIVEINSGGGEVDAASQMYTALRDYPGKVTTKICSAAYSAASYLAMAGDKVEISPAAKMMIHNSSSGAMGDYHDMDKTSQMLRATNETIANVYAKKCKRSVNDLLDLMDKETWLSPQDAIDLGLADCEIDFDKSPITMSVNNISVINHKAINNIKNIIRENEELKNKLKNSQPINEAIDKDKQLLQDKLAILNTEDK